MFRVIIVGGPAQDYIERCLSSLIFQGCTNWTAQVILDPVDNSFDLAKKFESDRIRIKKNVISCGALHNIVEAIKISDPADSDIIVTLDADDWLYDSKALDIVDRYYSADENLLVTHGSWTSYPNPKVRNNNYAYTESDFKLGIRKIAWRASHLRTFKYKVWKHVLNEDLRAENSNYFSSAWDLAMMWPMLEMAGYSRVKFIPEILYVYNQETPFNDSKLRLQEQMRYTNYMAVKRSYLHRETF